VITFLEQNLESQNLKQILPTSFISRDDWLDESCHSDGENG